MKTRSTLQRGLRRHRILLFAIALTGLGASFAGYQGAEQRRIQTHRDRIATTARAAAGNLDAQVRAASGIVESLAGFFENSEQVSPDEFSAFVERASVKCPALFAAAYQPYVRADQRADFEAAQRAAGLRGYEIVDSPSPRVMHRAPNRDFYVPIAHQHALRGELPPLGLDLHAYPQFMAPKWLALDRAQPAASRLVPCVSVSEAGRLERPGFVVNTAVLARGEGPPRARLRGFVSATLLAEPLLRAAVADVDTTGLRFSIRDAVTTAAPLAFELSGPGASASGATGLAPETHVIRLPGNTWTMIVTPTEGALRGAVEWLPGFVLLAGFGLTIVATMAVARAGRTRRHRELMEQERRAAERKFHEVVENMAGAVTVFGVGEGGNSFAVWDINAAAAALARDECGQIIGRSLQDVFGPELHEALHEAMRRVWASGRPEKLPPLPLTRGGRVRWLAANVFKLGSGEIVTVCTDTTAQKEVEEELRQARTELEMALEASRVGLWSWEIPRQCVRIDPRSAAILDVGATEVLAESDLRERIHAEDISRFETDVRAAFAAGREFEAEVRWRSRDGSWRRLCLRARAVHADTGCARLVGCVWDATQRRLLEETRQHQQRMDSISTLAGGIAHDLNNALAPLTMGLDLLRLRMSGDPDVADTIQAMSSSTRKAAAVVKQLSGLARSSADLVATCDPATVLNVFRRQLREAFPPGIGVQVPAPAEKLPAVQVSARQLQQAIQSLCVNAREAMRGSGTLTLAAHALRVEKAGSVGHPELEAGEYVVFTVRDTGPGIPKAIRDRIFDPFFTTKDPGRGTGLGLPTALAIVRSAGGTIQVETEVGAGSCFSIIVPVAAETPAGSAVPSGGAGAVGVTLRGRRVLLADDDVMVREVARRVLETAGMHVQVAGDGREALACFQQQPDNFDVVVLDMVMPEMDGATAGAAIRALRADVPLIGASGYAAESVLAQARAAGFTAFLPKPYTMDGLVDAVRHALAPQPARV